MIHHQPPHLTTPISYGKLDLFCFFLVHAADAVAQLAAAQLGLREQRMQLDAMEAESNALRHGIAKMTSDKLSLYDQVSFAFSWL